MLDVEDRLVDQVGNVAVVQGVADVPALALADHKAEMTEDAKLVGDRRGLHTDRRRKLVHRQPAVPQPREDTDTARRRQRLHRLGDLARRLPIDVDGARVAIDCVAHLTQSS